MAVKFNPSITNYKPSFAAKQKTPASSAHANLATAADSLSIAAKPAVKPNKIKMFFAGIPFVAASIMGASCEKPIDPPIIPTVDYTKKPVGTNFNNILEILGVQYNAKSGSKILTEAVVYKELNNTYHNIKVDYSNMDTLAIYDNSTVAGFSDTSKLKILLYNTPSELKTIQFADFGNGYIPVGSGDSYALSSDSKSLIHSSWGKPIYRIQKAAPNLMYSTLYESTGDNPQKEIRFISTKFENINTKNLKQACDNAVQVAIDSAKTASKKAVKTIR